jgi:hypothetical protein
VIERSQEALAFLSAVDAADPAAVSACAGWTTHQIAAHAAAIAVEVTRHPEPYLTGHPVPPTRSFEEREAPLQAMSHPHLLARLDQEEQRMRSVVSDVLDREPGAVIPWTGRQMAAATFVPHLRNEHALHRWDMTPTRTAISRPGCAARAGATCVCWWHGDATLAWADDTADEPTVEIDRAARHAFIWGRRPDRRGRLRSHLSQPDLARLQVLLSGY